MNISTILIPIILFFIFFLLIIFNNVVDDDDNYEKQMLLRNCQTNLNQLTKQYQRYYNILTNKT